MRRRTTRSRSYPIDAKVVTKVSFRYCYKLLGNCDFAIETQYEQQQLFQESKNIRLATSIMNVNLTFSKDLKRRIYTMNLCEINYSSSKKTRKLKLMSSHKLRLERNSINAS